MAKPRVLISSTFYDLSHARTDLSQFVKNIGYEAVLSERGSIPYANAEALETYCYREIEKVSIVVMIIGHRFGSESKVDNAYSVSMMELKTAVKLNKQLYCFVESSVLSEYRTYLKNKGKDIEFHHVDDVRVYRFIEEIYGLPINNQIVGFDSIPFITEYLKEQWAGLLEMYLQEQTQNRMNRLGDTIQSTTETLKGLVELLRNERLGLQTSVEERGRALDAIIIQNHPAFARLRSVMKLKHRVFFTTKDELTALVEAYGYRLDDEEVWEVYTHWNYTRKNDHLNQQVIVSKDVFNEDGTLKVVLAGDWDDEYISRVTLPVKKVSKASADLDDDIPF